MKSMTSTKNRSLVALIEGEHDNLKVVKLDGDQFILTAQQAVNACSAASDSVLFQAQFRDLLDKLYEWVEERKARVTSAYISTGQEGILLLVVQKGIKADFALEDELVQLDLDIANSKHIELVPFNTLLVPEVSDEVLQSFLSSSTKLSHKLHA